MSNLNEMIANGYGYVTIQALTKVVRVGMYTLNENEPLDTLNPLTILYLEINDDTCFVLGCADEFGDELTFGLSERSKVETFQGKLVVTKIF